MHDVNAAKAWLEDHGDYLYGYALSRIGDAHTAEDLVQETLLGVMQSREQFEGRSSVRTWLTSILRHKIIDHLRKATQMGERESRSYADETTLERFVDSQFYRRGKWRVLPGRWGKASEYPSSDAEQEEFRRALLSCLEQLPPRPAEAIGLAEHRGMSLEQISKILGVTATNAGVLLHRARVALRRCLELNWFRES